MPDDASTLLFRQAPRGLNRNDLRAFLRTLGETVTGGRTFCCLLTGDSELQRLNRRFLGHDYPTDVLSFPEPGPDGFLGEIAISHERAAAQAGEYGHGVEEEIKTLMLHGVLHLLGMDHETDGGRMARTEARWRRKLGLATGLIARQSARKASSSGLGRVRS